MSNFIVKQEGPSPRVAEKVWEIRPGGVWHLSSALLGVLVGAYLTRRGRSNGAEARPIDWPVNMAHRGGAGIAPENTLEAFREALRVGAGVLELDVRATADGRLVGIHDERVDRTTDGSGLVREMTLRDVKKLDAGYRFTADGGKTYPYRGRGVAVPTLQEVYDEFPDVPVNIEIKGRRPGIEEAVCGTIEDAGAAGRTLVVSGDTATTRRFRKACGGRVATGASSLEILAFYALYRSGLSGLLEPPYKALQGPETYKGLRVIAPGFVRAAHGLGVRVDVWTVNAEPDMRRLLGFGVDGIMTDRPDVLARVLGEEG